MFFLVLVSFKFLDEMRQDEVLDIVINKHLLNFRIIRLRRRGWTLTNKKNHDFVKNRPSGGNKIARKALYILTSAGTKSTGSNASASSPTECRSHRKVALNHWARFTYMWLVQLLTYWMRMEELGIHLRSRQMFSSDEADEIMQIPMGGLTMEDFLAWNYTKNGVFTVRLTYHLGM